MKLKQEPLTLGLMSGTSADGVSAVLASFKDRQFQIRDFSNFPYPSDVTESVHNAANLGTGQISALNFRLGEIFAQSALKILKKNKLGPKDVAVIGSHGQTLYHDPKGNPPSTLQIGEAAIIAERTGITVVSDFRPGDIAAGGEGAPLIPFFDNYFFGQGPARCFQNIGGIGNVSVVGKGIKKPLAFDTGPGNCLIDWAVRNISGGKLQFDQDGNIAKKGNILGQAVVKMSRHPFFSKRPPKSTGKELFNENFIPAELKKSLKDSPEDVVNTLTYFAAYSIAAGIKKYVLPRYPVKEVVVSGGGALNQTLMRHLQILIHPLALKSIQRLGIPFQAKEPLAFALFAWLTVQGKINHSPEGTGARKAVILGKITPGRNFKGLKP